MDQAESELEIQSSSEELVQSFDGFGLRSDLLSCIKDFGIEKPAKIQSEAIQSIVKRKNTIIQSPSGTGKTTAFVISLLHLINCEIKDCQAIILVHTRELGLSMQAYIRSLSQHIKASVHCCFDSNSVLNDQKQIQEGVHIIIGSPGRVLNLIETGHLKINNLKQFILDDADDILSRGQSEHISRILMMLDPKTQIIITSAMMPQDLKALTEKFADSFHIIYHKDDSPTLDNMKQFYILIDKEEWKFDTLIELYEMMGRSCLVYCNRNKTTQEVSSRLQEKISNVTVLHVGMDQNERNQVMNEYIAATSSILVTTDLCDPKSEKKTIVVNYDFPLSKEGYLKRSGKTPEYGIGVVINFVLPIDYNLMQGIEKFYNVKIDELPVDINDII